MLNLRSLLEVISTRVGARKLGHTTRPQQSPCPQQPLTLQGLETDLKSELWPLLLGIRSPTSTAEELAEQYAQLKQQYLECVSCCKVGNMWLHHKQYES